MIHRNAKNKTMVSWNENDLSALLLDDALLRRVEPDIFSVLPDNETGSVYDTRFGSIYDRVACNWVYNRLIWGYSIRIFSRIAEDVLSTAGGAVLDLGCGSLAFTAKAYGRFPERPVVLLDQSLTMLRMAKSRLIRRMGRVPGNLLLLHADAQHLPFREGAFRKILCENFLHCIGDSAGLLLPCGQMVSKGGEMVFTTLVRSGRISDRYLQVLADSGKLVSRTAGDRREVLERIGWDCRFETIGNILIVHCRCG